ncbi:MAG TPA: MoxR family ATPase [Planctomycetota bacterium]|nr:MoxR family ATPase [Planctomycetota bacterium]
MPDVTADVKRFTENFARIRAEIAKSIVGQEEIVEGVLTALFAGGHVLLEGLPGLGKTRLVRALADALDLDFARIQCTPDLMPADIIGTTILTGDERGARRFEFQRGPVFSNLLLADEINRATPKTQSALLQAMQENAVTVGNTTYPLAQPYIVLATQNPIELEGTYPLPEAQLDRFMLKLLVRPVELAALIAILELTTTGAETKTAKVLSKEDVVSARALVANVPAAPALVEFAARLVLATNPANKDAPKSVHANVRYGASPRGAQAILMCAKVHALAAGRFHVAIDDLKKAARPALRHRLILNFEGEAGGIATDRLIDEIVADLEAARK